MMDMVEVMGACRFCGKMIAVLAPTEDADNQRMIDETATNMCKCAAAATERSKQGLDQKIDSVLGSDSVRYGFSGAMGEGTIAAIRGICESVIAGALGQVSIQACGEKIRVKLNRKGDISIKRETKQQIEM